MAEDTHSPPDRRTRKRVRLVLLGLLSYLMFLVPMCIAVLAGASRMGWGGVAGFTAAAVVINLVVLAAVASGWSKRFADPSLMVPQLVAAIALALAMIHFFQGEARSVLLLLFVAIFFFGLFGLTTRQYLRLTIGTAVGYAALSTWELRGGDAPTQAWLMEALRFSALVVITIWMSFIGGYLASIRRRLSKQRDALEKANAKLQELSIRDELTGLYNRRHLTERLEQESERGRRYGQGFSVALIDIDHFKAINDTHGHSVGDEVLVQFAAILRLQARFIDHVGQAPERTLGRFGGEEFMIILPGTSLAGARICLERMRAAVARAPFETSAGPVEVTFSAGLAEQQPDEAAEALLQRADEALYRAKESGRDRLEMDARTS
ncbi:GGDEF domain-containing protein [Arenimonas sp.]|uniref:GGDEF domain-containing protein n=1 Tax=Arenimonas sp. TaxID=1872635 RepID=UPI0035ADB317